MKALLDHRPLFASRFSSTLRSAFVENPTSSFCADNEQFQHRCYPFCLRSTRLLRNLHAQRNDISVGPLLQGSNRSAGKGRRRRALAEQRRAEQELWSHVVRNGEEDFYVAPPTRPTNRRQLRRAARRSSHEDWEHTDDDHLAMALALSLSLLEPPPRNEESPVDSTTLPEYQHLDLSYESLVMLENVKCTAPAALIRSLTGHIFSKESPVSAFPSVDELCTICHVEFKEGDSCMILPCVHAFHDLCGSEWFLNHSKLCPVCKHDITENV